VIIIMLLVFLAVYAFGCFINYRMVVKFDPATTYPVNLIPFWNWYLIIRVAVRSPATFFWLTLPVPFILTALGKALDVSSITHLGTIISLLVTARVYGSIAEKLGKNFWLYAVLMFIPLVNVIPTLILAFDGSRPVAPDPKDIIIG